MSETRITNRINSFQKRDETQRSFHEAQKSSGSLAFAVLASLVETQENDVPQFLSSLSRSLQSGLLLEEAFQALSDREKESVQQFCEPALLKKIFSLSQEPQKEILLSGFLDLARSLKADQDDERSARIFSLVKEEGRDFPDLQGLAERELNALQGRGNFGGRFEYFAGRLAQEALDTRSIAPMVAATVLGGIVKAATLAKFAGAGEAWYSRGMTARALAGMFSFAAEVPTFTALSRGLRQVGEKSKYQSSYSDELLGATTTLGLLKIAGSLSRAGFLHLHAANEFGVATRFRDLATLSQAFLAPTTMFGGLLFAHWAEERLGLRESSDNATRITESLHSMVSLSIGAYLGDVLLNLGFSNWMQEIHHRSQAPWQNEGQRALALMKNPFLAPVWMAMGAGGLGGFMFDYENQSTLARLTKDAKNLKPGLKPERLPVLHFPDGRHSKPEEDTFKLATYNLGYASGAKNNTTQALSLPEMLGNLESAIASLRAFDPDVICLQEVDFASARTHRFDQMAFLARGLEMAYAAPVVTWDVSYLPFPFSLNPKHHFGRVLSGQVIFSRLPIELHEAIKFEKPASNPSWYNWFYLDRIVQRITLEKDYKTHHLWNAHLEPFDPEVRMEQTKKLASWVRTTRDGRKFVGGDFNSSIHFREGLGPPQLEELMKITGKHNQKIWTRIGKPFSEGYLQTMQEMVGASHRQFLWSSRLTNAEAKSSLYTFPTWDSTGPWMKLDHIAYPKYVYSPVEVKTDESLKASDHRPLMAEFKSEV